MKKKGIFGCLAVAFALALLGCPQDPHTAERAENALIGTQHQIALEVCLKEASMAKHTDADAGQIRVDFEKCMAEADKAAGKK